MSYLFSTPQLVIFEWMEKNLLFWKLVNKGKESSFSCHSYINCTSGYQMSWLAVFLCRIRLGNKWKKRLTWKKYFETPNELIDLGSNNYHKLSIFILCSHSLSLPPSFLLSQTLLTQETDVSASWGQQKTADIVFLTKKIEIEFDLASENN